MHSAKISSREQLGKRDGVVYVSKLFQLPCFSSLFPGPVASDALWQGVNDSIPHLISLGLVWLEARSGREIKVVSCVNKTGTFCCRGFSDFMLNMNPFKNLVEATQTPSHKGHVQQRKRI